MAEAPTTTENGQIVPRRQAQQSMQAVLQNQAVQTWLREILPKQIRVETFTRIAMTSLRRNPDLLNCDPGSFLSAVLASASLGLQLDNTLGHAYLVPYKKECTLIVGYKGYQELAYRSGRVLNIYAEVVRNANQAGGDEFEWEYGLKPTLRHKVVAEPDIRNHRANSGQTFMHITGQNVTHAYAVAHLSNGAERFVVLTRKELDAIKTRSRASHSGPWVTDPEEMFKKTAIRRLAKSLPLSPEIQGLFSLDEAAEEGRSQDFAQLGISTPFTEGATTGEATEHVNTETGEITTDPPEAAPKQEDEDEPTQYGRCPIHKKAWEMSSYGGFFHKGEKRGDSCSPAKVVSAKVQELGLEAADASNESKAMFDGLTPGKLDGEQLEKLLAKLEARAGIQKAEPPASDGPAGTEDVPPPAAEEPEADPDDEPGEASYSDEPPF